MAGGNKNNGTTSRTLTVRQAAEEAGVSTQAVRRWIAYGKLAAYRFPGSGRKQPEMLRIDRKEFEQFLKGCHERL